MRIIVSAIMLLTITSVNASIIDSNPSTVCNYLTNSGLATRGWNNHYDNEYGCVIPPKNHRGYL